MLARRDPGDVLTRRRARATGETSLATGAQPARDASGRRGRTERQQRLVGASQRSRLIGLARGESGLVRTPELRPQELGALEVAGEAGGVRRRRDGRGRLVETRAAPPEC